jgi:hypothetical protein
MTRRAAHGVGFLALGFEHNRTHRVDHHFQKGDVKRPEYQGQIEQQRDQSQPGDRHMDREEIGHGLAQIVVDPSAKADSGDDRREVVIEQDQGSGVARDIRCRARPWRCRYAPLSIGIPIPVVLLQLPDLDQIKKQIVGGGHAPFLRKDLEIAIVPRKRLQESGFQCLLRVTGGGAVSGCEQPLYPQLRKNRHPAKASRRC